MKVVSIFVAYKVSIEAVNAVAYTGNNQYIVSGSGDKSIKIFNVETKTEIYQFKNAHKSILTFKSVLIFQDAIKTMVTTKDSRYIISGSGDRSIKIFDIETKAEVYEFREAHADWIVTIALSSDDKYLVSGSFDKSVKVFDLETKAQVYHYKNIHRDWIRSVVVTKDGKHIVSGSKDTSMKVLKMPFVDTAKELNFVSLSASPFLSFGANTENLLSGLHDPKVISAYQDIYILPHNWTALHLLAVTDPSKIEEIPPYSKFKMPFLVDKHQRTPLHYLFAHDKINYNAANIILKYLIEYLEDSGKPRLDYKKICDSVSNILPFMMMKMNSRLVSQFLNLCFIPTPTPFGDSLHKFGEPIKKYTFTQSFVILPEVKNKIVKDGDQQITYKTSLFRCDYNPVSDDVFHLVTHLNYVQKEEIFQSPPISHFINYVWNQIYSHMIGLAVAYSILMLLITIYLGSGDRVLALEIIILVITTFFLAWELFQFIALGKKYLKSVWNLIDNIYLFLIVAYIISRFANQDGSHPLYEEWMSSVIVVVGYVRWVSFLRLFSTTRSLIQIILSILSDMIGFMIVLVFITIGFSIVFLEFDRDNDYSVHLYSTYKLLYATFEDSDSNVSQKLFLSLILFLLNVVLLNMLISIMGDSYARTQEKKVLTDSLTRLEMIQETLVLLRVLRMKNGVSKKGYLIFCGSEGEEEEALNAEGDARVIMMKKMLKQAEERMHHAHNETKQEIKQEVSQVRQDMKALEQIVSRNCEDIMNAIRLISK